MIGDVIPSRGGTRSAKDLGHYILYPEEVREAGRDASTLHGYLFREGAEVRGAYAFHGTTSVETWAAEVRATLRRNPRANEDRHVMHFVLALDPTKGENATDAEMLDYARRALAQLRNSKPGYKSLAEHQWLAAVHHDKEHLHVHVAVSLVDPETGRINHPSRSFETIERVIREISVERGWERVAGGALDRRADRGIDRAPDAADGLSRGAAEYEARTRVASVERRFRDVVADEARTLLERDGATVADYRALVERHGFDARRRGSGYVLVDRETGVRVKPSRFGLSLRTVERALGGTLLDSRTERAFVGRTADDLANYAAPARPALEAAIATRDGRNVQAVAAEHGLGIVRKGGGFVAYALDAPDGPTVKLTDLTSRARGLAKSLENPMPPPAASPRKEDMDLDMRPDLASVAQARAWAGANAERWRDRAETLRESADAEPDPGRAHELRADAVRAEGEANVADALRSHLLDAERAGILSLGVSLPEGEIADDAFIAAVNEARDDAQARGLDGPEHDAINVPPVGDLFEEGDGLDAAASQRAFAERERANTIASRAEKLAQDPMPVVRRMEKERATFTEREFAWVLTRKYNLTDSQAERAIGNVAPRLLTLEERSEADGSRRFGTKEMLDLETSLRDAATKLAGEVGIDARGAVDRDGDKYARLNDPQRRAVELMTDETRFAAVIGPPGTGKSSAMEIAREAWERTGLVVVGATLSNKASDALFESAGIESRSVAKRLHDLDNGRLVFTPRHVLAVDEAATLGSSQAYRLIRAAEAGGAKVVYAFDTAQLHAIEAGGQARLIERSLPGRVVELEQVVRQRDPEMQAATRAMYEGIRAKDPDRFAEGLAYYERAGRLVFSATPIADAAQRAREWTERDGAGHVVGMVTTHRDTLAFGEATRDGMIARGEIDPATKAHVRVRPHVNDSVFLDIKNPDAGERDLYVGDRVLFREKSRDLGVINGTTGTLREIDAETGRARVTLDDGTDVRFALYENHADGAHPFFNAVDLGYASTAYRAQGVTAERAVAVVGGLDDPNSMLVKLSRHKGDVALFVDSSAFGDAADLVDHMRERFRDKDLVLDYVERRAEPSERTMLEAPALERRSLAERVAATERVFDREDVARRIAEARERELAQRAQREEPRAQDAERDPAPPDVTRREPVAGRAEPAAIERDEREKMGMVETFGHDRDPLRAVDETYAEEAQRDRIKRFVEARELRDETRARDRATLWDVAATVLPRPLAEIAERKRDAHLQTLAAAGQEPAAWSSLQERRDHIAHRERENVGRDLDRRGSLDRWRVAMLGTLADLTTDRLGAFPDAAHRAAVERAELRANLAGAPDAFEGLVAKREGASTVFRRGDDVAFVVSARRITDIGSQRDWDAAALYAQSAWGGMTLYGTEKEKRDQLQRAVKLGVRIRNGEREICTPRARAVIERVLHAVAPAAFGRARRAERGWEVPAWMNRDSWMQKEQVQLVRDRVRPLQRQRLPDRDITFERPQRTEVPKGVLADREREGPSSERTMEPRPDRSERAPLLQRFAERGADVRDPQVKAWARLETGAPRTLARDAAERNAGGEVSWTGERGSGRIVAVRPIRNEERAFVVVRDERDGALRGREVEREALIRPDGKPLERGHRAAVDGDGLDDAYMARQYPAARARDDRDERDHDRERAERERDDEREHELDF